MSDAEAIGFVIMIFPPTWFYTTLFLLSYYDLLQAIIFGFVISVVASVFVMPAFLITVLGLMFTALWILFQFYQLVMAL